MVEVQIPQIRVTCVYCEQLYEPADLISLNPVCLDCAASRKVQGSAGGLRHSRRTVSKQPDPDGSANRRRPRRPARSGCYDGGRSEKVARLTVYAREARGHPRTNAVGRRICEDVHQLASVLQAGREHDETAQAA